jgi:hypothetical protein
MVGEQTPQQQERGHLGKQDFKKTDGTIKTPGPGLA